MLHGWNSHQLSQLVLSCVKRGTVEQAGLMVRLGDLTAPFQP